MGSRQLYPFETCEQILILYISWTPFKFRHMLWAIVTVYFGIDYLLYLVFSSLLHMWELFDSILEHFYLLNIVLIPLLSLLQPFLIILTLLVVLRNQHFDFLLVIVQHLLRDHGWSLAFEYWALVGCEMNALMRCKRCIESFLIHVLLLHGHQSLLQTLNCQLSLCREHGSDYSLHFTYVFFSNLIFLKRRLINLKSFELRGEKSPKMIKPLFGKVLKMLKTFKVHFF